MNETLHGFIFGVMMIGYTWFVWKKWPISYDRINCYSIISLIMVDWIAVLAVIANITNTQD